MTMSLSEELRHIANIVLEEDKKLLKGYYKDIDKILRGSAEKGNHQAAISFCDSGEKTISYIPNIELIGIQNKVESIKIIMDHYKKEGFVTSEDWCGDDEDLSVEVKVISFQW